MGNVNDGHNFQRDVEAIMPFRKRYLTLSEAEGEAELNTVLANTSTKIVMNPEDGEYWNSVIAESDKRLSIVSEAKDRVLDTSNGLKWEY